MFEKRKHVLRCSVGSGARRPGTGASPRTIAQPSLARSPNTIARRAVWRGHPRRARIPIDGARRAASIWPVERSDQRTADRRRPDVVRRAAPGPRTDGPCPKTELHGARSSRPTRAPYAMTVRDGAHPCTNPRAHCTCRRHRPVRSDMRRSVYGRPACARYRRRSGPDASPRKCPALSMQPVATAAQSAHRIGRRSTGRENAALTMTLNEGNLSRAARD